ncbi:hypothetical protein HMPREF1219_01680 [Corynebacterium pyruviciproducens ATCC BAA-1742]|uniref:DUF559 domain-containing protein n=2 Tax=Corynebacterium pyruviciproducens TaxID=598660 RepID=S2ZWQ8_9CORY|nr:hypothetical protein HMPREF1219_01680 [Corynebacterium pyruviciproducens ATCC BAA-1742]
MLGEDIIFTGDFSHSGKQRISGRFRRGELIKLARGMYVPRDTFAGLRPGEKSVLRSGALGISGRVLVGRSAGAMWRLPQVDERHGFPAEVKGRTDAPLPGVVNRFCSAAGITQFTWAGRLIAVTSPELTVIDIARWHGLHEAVIIGDQLANRGLITHALLIKALAQRRRAAGIATARAAVGLINNLSESPRESEVKAALYENYIHGFRQQVTIISSAGKRIGRLDFFNREHSVGLEYDGHGKTHGQFGTSPDVAREKERARERELVSEGIYLVRVAKDTFASGEWLDSLTRALEVNRGRCFPQEQVLPPNRHSYTAGWS